MLTYSYSIFGLKISSELECSELQPTDEECDIRICFGKVPIALANPKITGVRFERNENEFLLNVDDVADYYVSSNEVVIHQHDNSDPDSIKLFLYNSILPALLLLHKSIPLRGSVLERDGKSFMILGNDGAGKSTTAAAFYKKGYNIISDDISVLKFVDGIARALPGIIYPVLWEDALIHFSGDLKNFKKTRPVLRRYWLNNVVCNYNEKHTLEKIFLITENNCGKIECNKVDGEKKQTFLQESTMGESFLFGEEIKEMQSLQFDEVARKVEMWTLCRPTVVNTIDETILLMEEKLKQ